MNNSWWKGRREREWSRCRKTRQEAVRRRRKKARGKREGVRNKEWQQVWEKIRRRNRRTSKGAERSWRGTCLCKDNWIVLRILPTVWKVRSQQSILYLFHFCQWYICRYSLTYKRKQVSRQAGRQAGHCCHHHLRLVLLLRQEQRSKGFGCERLLSSSSSAQHKGVRNLGSQGQFSLCLNTHNLCWH